MKHALKDILEKALEPVKNEIAILPGKKYLGEIIDKVTTKANEKLDTQEVKIISLEDRVYIIESKLVLGAQFQVFIQYVTKLCVMS